MNHLALREPGRGVLFGRAMHDPEELRPIYHWNPLWTVEYLEKARIVIFRDPSVRPPFPQDLQKDFAIALDHMYGTVVEAYFEVEIRPDAGVINLPKNKKRKVSRSLTPGRSKLIDFLESKELALSIDAKRRPLMKHMVADYCAYRGWSTTDDSLNERVRKNIRDHDAKVEAHKAAGGDGRYWADSR